MDTSAHPSPAPQGSTLDRFPGSMSPAPATTSTIPTIPSHRPSSSLSFNASQHSQTNIPVPSPAPVSGYAPSVMQQPMQTQSSSLNANQSQDNPQVQRVPLQQQHPSLSHSQYIQNMHNLHPMSIFFPLASGEQGIEIPLQLPPSLLSNETKKKLQDEQDVILAAEAKLFKGKKRKKDGDEVPDESSGYLEPRETGSAQKKFYLEVINRLKTEKDESGRSLAAPINNLPSQEKFPQFYQCVSMSRCHSMHDG